MVTNDGDLGAATGPKSGRPVIGPTGLMGDVPSGRRMKIRLVEGLFAIRNP